MNGETFCCICHVRVEKPKILGGRAYCERCHAKVTKERGGLWQAGIVEIVALLIFVALVAFVGAPLIRSAGIESRRPEDPVVILIGIILALIPALIWLAFFYQQDRLEPEPKPYVFGVFLLGVLLAGAVSTPLTRDLFQVEDWLYQSALSRILGSILVIGFVQEFLKYAAVRYSVYSSAEFDERVDGVIYATAAGLGFATMLNFQYVLAFGGVDPTVGAIRMVVNALAHASFAGVIGYFLGQAKFEAKGPLWLPAGLCLVAIINGLFFYVEDVATSQGLQFRPAYGLALAAAIAILTFAAVFYLIRRANARTLAESSAE